MIFPHLTIAFIILNLYLITLPDRWINIQFPVFDKHKQLLIGRVPLEIELFLSHSWSNVPLAVNIEHVTQFDLGRGRVVRVLLIWVDVFVVG